MSHAPLGLGALWEWEPCKRGGGNILVTKVPLTFGSAYIKTAKVFLYLFHNLIKNLIQDKDLYYLIFNIK